MDRGSADKRSAWFESMWVDWRCALRRLGNVRSGAVGVVAVLGLAIGIVTAMFAILDALFWRPVPFAAPDQLAIVHMRGRVGGLRAVPPAVFSAWRRSPAFEQVEAARSETAFVATDEGLIKRATAFVTPGVFDLLGGVRPVRGRLFEASAARAGADDQVLISEDLWRGFFRGDPAIMGRVVAIDKRPATVIGILPSAFHFPDWNTAIWRVSDCEATQPDVSEDSPTVYVRFKRQIPRPDALRLATADARSAVARFDKQWAEALPLVASDEKQQRAVPLFVGGIILIFLELCANASSLLLIGLTARGRELETRLALGAPRARLVRQALLEAAVACAGAVVVGIGVGWALVCVARGVVPRVFLAQSLHALNLDTRALVAASIAAGAALLCAGVLPAVIGTRLDGRISSQLSMRASTETTRARRTRRALLIAQIAVSCTLLLASALLVRSFLNLMTKDRGLDPSRILVATVVFPQRQFSTQAARTMAGEEIARQARMFPGVQRTSWSYGVPPEGGRKPGGAWLSDSPGASSVTTEVSQFAIDDEFLALYGIRILQGRPFEPSDGPESVLVSERFARALWPGGSAVDHGFSLDKKRRFRVVGVVREIRYPSLDEGMDVPQLYGPLRHVDILSFLSIRCGATCPAPALVQQRLGQSGADVEDVRPLVDKYAAEVARPRAVAVLAFAFALTALVASATGLFGLLSRSVARRRREFGIRAALGAPPSALRYLVWREGLTVTLSGMAIGTVAGLWVAQALSRLLFEVGSADPASWALVMGGLAATMAAASWRPARIASRAPLSVLLREE